MLSGIQNCHYIFNVGEGAGVEECKQQDYIWTIHFGGCKSETKDRADFLFLIGWRSCGLLSLEQSHPAKKGEMGQFLLDLSQGQFARPPVSLISLEGSLPFLIPFQSSRRTS